MQSHDDEIRKAKRKAYVKAYRERLRAELRQAMIATGLDPDATLSINRHAPNATEIADAMARIANRKAEREAKIADANAKREAKIAARTAKANANRVARAVPRAVTAKWAIKALSIERRRAAVREAMIATGIDPDAVIAVTPMTIDALSADDREKLKAEWRADGSRDRARRRGAPGSHTGADHLAILKLQKYRCAYYSVCKQRLDKDRGTYPSGCKRPRYHMDHIIALVSGGTNDRTNLQATCPTCNCRKHKKNPLIFARELGLLL